jgi:ammonia channel protein AmtB
MGGSTLTGIFVRRNIAFHSNKFLGHSHSFPFIANLTMDIYGTVLIQVYATVLTGVLFFMTVQRLFEWRERFEEKSSRLIQLREKIMEEKMYFWEVCRGMKSRGEKISS